MIALPLASKFRFRLRRVVYFCDNLRFFQNLFFHEYIKYNTNIFEGLNLLSLLHCCADVIIRGGLKTTCSFSAGSNPAYWLCAVGFQKVNVIS